MAATGSSALLACFLLASAMLITVLGAPPQPPSISAAISPHPQQPQPSQETIQHLQHRLSEEDLNNDAPHSHFKRPFVKETLAKRNFLKQRQHEDDLLESNDIDDQTSDDMRMPLLSSDLYDSDDTPNVEQNEETEPAPGSRLDEDDVETDSNEDLGPALRELARRKRNPKTASEARPYSATRARSPSRYRYPLHRKRSSRIPQQHSYSRDDPNDSLFALYDDYPDSDVIYGPGRMMTQGPSLFRERASAPEPAREMFLEEPLPLSMLQAEGPATENKRQFTPVGKSPYDVGVPDETYGGEEGAEAPGEISLELLKNTLDSIQRRKLEEEIRENQLRNEESELLEELVNKAAEEYYRENRPLDRYDLSNAMIRQKRSVHPSAAAIHDSKSIKSNTTNTTAIKIKTPERVTVAEYRAELAADRKKRAFGTSVLYDRRKKNYSHVAPSKKRSQEELDDFLTREYFKDIARSVGNKKKRMAYGKFEADKRSNSIDAFLDNPEMLQYMMDKLKEAEDTVAQEAEADMVSDASRGGGSEGSFLLRNAIVRLDALERMRESLEQLKTLQEQEEGSNGEGERRKKKKKKSSLPVTHPRLQQQQAVHPLLQHIQYLECPPLQRVLSTCATVSSVAGDAGQVFVPACVRHEVCYMCGSGLGVTRHECDALLSSALEAPCEGALNCLGAAGETFALLSDGRRYSEDAGSCVHQACVRNILESRR